MHNRTGRLLTCCFATKRPSRCLPFESISYLPEMRFGGASTVSGVPGASIHTLPLAMFWHFRPYDSADAAARWVAAESGDV